MDTIIWEDIPGFEGIYRVSNYGDILSYHYNRILKPYLTKDGYYKVILCNNRYRKNMLVHQIVGIVFCDNPNGYTELNHEDGNKLNNFSGNLRWCTRTYNIQHSYDTGLRTKKYGGEHHNSKKIAQYRIDGTIIKIWNSMSDATREYNISHSKISMCCTGKRNTAGGYLWKYL